MNTPRILALLLLGHGLALAEPHGEPYEPTGKLNAGRFWSSHSTGPELAWRIRPPIRCSNLIHLDPTTGSLTTRTALRMRVHVLGVGEKTSADPHRAAFWVRTGIQSGWQLLFDGTPEAVRARTPVLDQPVDPNTRIDLAARAYGGEESSWRALRSTGSPGHGIMQLVDGDPLPTAISIDPEPFLNACLSPETRPSGARSVSTGPKDLVVFFELSDASPGEPSFDLQDLVVLVTFEAL